MSEPEESYWNYRVVKSIADGQDWYAIHEVYYDSSGDIKFMTETSSAVVSESLNGLLDVLNMMTGALIKPVLDEDTLREEDTIMVNCPYCHKYVMGGEPHICIDGKDYTAISERHAIDTLIKVHGELQSKYDSLLQEYKVIEAKLENAIEELKFVKEQIQNGTDPTPLETWRFIDMLGKKLKEKFEEQK